MTSDLLLLLNIICNILREEARARTAVLRRLGHVDEESVVLLKGRAACEIDTADELLTAELMFNGTLIGGS